MEPAAASRDPEAFDLAEGRERFRLRLERVGLQQQRTAIAATREDAIQAARDVGYPAVIRPSSVLGGRPMRIARNEAEPDAHARVVLGASGNSPILIDGFLDRTIEPNVDALFDGDMVWVAGILEHVKEAGIHSGDRACAIPPPAVPATILDEVCRQTDILARDPGFCGLMNVQHAVRDQDVFVLVVNPRASKTAPVIAKAVGVPIIRIAARLAAGEKLASFASSASPSRTPS